MVRLQERESIEDALRLATDLCLALGAFALGLTGAVQLYVSEAVPPDDVPRRMERLARSCLVHPAVHGRELFWNAEVATDSEFADRSLACAVMPVWNECQVGLLGIVDTWLPEPDDDQRAGLSALAAQLARTLPVLIRRQAGGGPAATVAPGGEGHLARRVADATPAPPPAAAPAGPPAETAPAIFVGGEPDTRSGHAPPADATQLRDTGSTVPAVPAVAPVAEGHPAVSPAQAPAPVRRPEPPGPAPGWSQSTVPPISWGAPWPTGDPRTGAFHPHAPTPAVDLRNIEPGPVPSPAIDAADLVAALDDAVVCLDGAGTVVVANRAADVLYGLGPGHSLVGSALPETHAFRTDEGQPISRDQHPALLVLRDGVERTVPLLVGEKETQRRFAVCARVFTVAGGGGVVVVMHDTTAEWMEQQRLSRYAMYDPLTGLANRYLLLEELRRMLQGLGRRGGSVSLVYLDLDKFKLINDEHGHDMGDEVLGAVARRLRGAVRGDDVVARLGGDEFVLAHASADTRPDGDLVVSRLRKVLSAPFRVRGRAFDVGASIGWVSTDRGDVGPEALLSRADRAMYQSKRDRAARRPPT